MNFVLVFAFFLASSPAFSTTNQPECKCVGLAGNFPGVSVVCDGVIVESFPFHNEQATERAFEQCREALNRPRYGCELFRHNGTVRLFFNSQDQAFATHAFTRSINDASYRMVVELRVKGSDLSVRVSDDTDSEMGIVRSEVLSTKFPLGMERFSIKLNNPSLQINCYLF